MSETAPAVLYRYVDEVDDEGGRVTIHLVAHPVIKKTPKGVRLANGKFVLLEGRKRYAYPSRADALTSYRQRKRFQLRWAATHEATAKAALELLEAGVFDSWDLDYNKDPAPATTQGEAAP